MVKQKSGKTETGVGTAFSFEPYRPERLDKLPPCKASCPSGTPVRDWIAEIAQAPGDEAGRREAYTRAWRLLVTYNPFPATMGRICPHPCEADCNRMEKDGAVAIDALERFLGDWAIDEGLALPKVESGQWPESIGVIGAGPAGLSFAYQMKRKGYPVTVYERHSEAGGMLRYGVPAYRLPRTVLDAELARIVQLGVELIAPIRVGIDISIAELQSRHRVLFLGLGAQRARRLGLPDEKGDNVWTGIEYLESYNRGETPELGEHVVVVGGGNTAIDVARAARRSGSAVTLLYRRCRKDMPAIEEEVNAALEEGVDMRFLTSPVGLIRGETGTLSAIRVQQMRAVDTNGSARTEVEPIPGDTQTLLTSSLVSAISQEADWLGIEAVAPKNGFLDSITQDAESGGSLLCTGGDVTGLDLASHAIGQGQITAERVHAQLRGLPVSGPGTAPSPAVKTDHYTPCERVLVNDVPVADRLASATQETRQTISEEAFLQEISRCFSCGLCNGCSLCWMYCGGNGFTRIESPQAGQYFAFSTDECTGCGKCIELCPTGYISAAEGDSV